MSRNPNTGSVKHNLDSRKNLFFRNHKARKVAENIQTIFQFEIWYLEKIKTNTMIKGVQILLLILFCVVACQSPDSNKQVGDDSAIVNESAKARIDSTLQTLVDSGKVVGISALIFEKGKEVYFNAVGFADREANTTHGPKYHRKDLFHDKAHHGISVNETSRTGRLPTRRSDFKIRA